MSSRVRLLLLSLFTLVAAGCSSRTVVLSNSAGTKHFSYKCSQFAPQINDLADIDVLATEFKTLAGGFHDGGVSQVDFLGIASSFDKNDFREVERRIVDLKCRKP